LEFLQQVIIRVVIFYEFENFFTKASFDPYLYLNNIRSAFVFENICICFKNMKTGMGRALSDLCLIPFPPPSLGGV
jgi:hypothetical protein